MRRGTRAGAAVVGLTLLGLAGLGLAAASFGRGRPVLVNTTPSVPEGLYLPARRQVIARGVLVAAEPPPQARAYLTSLGAPPDLRLLKRVAATAGDRVCARNGVLTWPGGAGIALRRDRRGVPLRAWSGCRVLAQDELLLVGDTRTSFDSRYFGPVRRAEILAVYVEALRW